MASQWHVRREDGEHGPLSSAELKALVVRGELVPEDSVRKGESGRWRHAGEIKGLFPSQAVVDDPFDMASLAEMEAQAVTTPRSLPTMAVDPPQAVAGGARSPRSDSTNAATSVAQPAPQPAKKFELSQKNLLIVWGAVAGVGVLLFLIALAAVQSLGPGPCEVDSSQQIASVPLGVGRYLVRENNAGEFLLVRVEIDTTLATRGGSDRKSVSPSDFKLETGVRTVSPLAVLDAEQHSSSMQVEYQLLAENQLELPFLLGDHPDLNASRTGRSFSESNSFGSSRQSNINHELLAPMTGSVEISSSATSGPYGVPDYASVSGTASMPLEDGGKVSWDFGGGSIQWQGDWIGYGPRGSDSEEQKKETGRHSLVLLFDNPTVQNGMKLRFREERPVAVPAP
ncbi:MAG: DUF4339 domain-containing protein [Pirellulaceae bacterium]